MAAGGARRNPGTPPLAVEVMVNSEESGGPGEREAGRTQKPHTYLDWGPTLLIIGLFVMAIVWTVTITEPIPEVAASMARTVAMVLVLTGVFFTVVSHAERRVVEKTRVMVVGMRQTEEAIAVQLDDNAEKISYLMAAPTVRLEEAKREFRAIENSILDGIEAAAQVHTNRAVERICKTFEDRFDELDQAVADMGAAVSQMRDRHLSEVEEAYEVGRLTGHTGGPV